MSEEEKEAIDKLSGKQNETTWVDTIRKIKREEINDAVITRQKYITTILNLIEKQQKEIEEFYREININTEIHKRDMKIKELEEVNNCLHESSKELFISKDKIREKTKELEKKKNCGNSIVFWEISSQIDLLKELLEENNKCK